MKLNEFLNANQNQWKNLVTRNKNFKVELYGANGHLKTLTAEYQNDYDYMQIYREMKIAFWEIREKDIIIVELEY